MTRRFEFETDTQRANAAWRAEVDESLARIKAEAATGTGA